MIFPTLKIIKRICVIKVLLDYLQKTRVVSMYSVTALVILERDCATESGSNGSSSFVIFVKTFHLLVRVTCISSLSHKVTCIFLYWNF